jgi:hypothetical protein
MAKAHFAFGKVSSKWEDCNLNLITIGKLNTEVNNYVPFWQTTILNEQNVSFPLYIQRKEWITIIIVLVISILYVF